MLESHTVVLTSNTCKISAMPRVTGCHHILRIKHLCSKFWHSESSVLLRSSSGEWSKTRHKEVETGEWNHVDSKLSQVSIELTREPETSGHTTHGQRHQVVKVTVGGGGELQGSEADVIEGLIVNTVGLICVLNQLVDR